MTWKNLPHRIWRTAGRILLAHRTRDDWSQVVIHDNRSAPFTGRHKSGCPSKLCDDAVLRNDPARAVALLDDYDCDLLFSATVHRAAYQWMPETARWAETHADHLTGKAEHRYLNAGVFVGKTDFLREVVAAAADPVTADDPSTREYIRALEKGPLSDQRPDFPKGGGCDQAILRYPHPGLSPRLKIGFHSRIASR